MGLFFGPTDETRDVLTYSVVKTHVSLDLSVNGLRDGLLPCLDLTLERDGQQGVVRIKTTSDSVFQDPMPQRQSVFHIDSLLAVLLDQSGEETDLQLEGYLSINTEVTAPGTPAGTLRLFPQSRDERM
ncbi:hypothetical protein CYG49_03075 [Candidatus Saccharibacteria bacterium]|nr:MAG: hypothetical protein CYG49_03075 [Candidatus Saccharibacteria bacterium]